MADEVIFLDDVLQEIKTLAKQVAKTDCIDDTYIWWFDRVEGSLKDWAQNTIDMVDKVIDMVDKVIEEHQIEGWHAYVD